MFGKFDLFGGWAETPASVWSIAPGPGRLMTVIITYTVNRRPFSTQLYTDLPFTPGLIFPLRYDPSNPKRNELSVRQNWRRGLIRGSIAVVAATVVILLSLGTYFRWF